MVKKLKELPQKIKKCPYVLLVIITSMVIGIYGVLINFGVIKPKNAFDTPALTDIAVASAVHNIKAYFSPDMDYEPVKFVPPTGDGTAAVSQNGGAEEAKAPEAALSEASAEAAAKKAPEKEDEEKSDEEKTEEDKEEGEEDSEEEDEENKEEDDGSFSPYGDFVSVEDDYFDERTAFIGDSRTKGFVLYSGLDRIASFAESGYAIHSVFKKQIVKTPVGNFTLDQMMAAEPDRFDKIYLKFGLNELGWGNEEIFAQNYYALIDMLKYYQPNAVIYVQAIFPVTKSKAASSKIYDNDRIAVRNETLKQIAENEHVAFLNLNPVYADEEGYLPEDYAPDGIHLKAQYIELWKDYLKQHAIVKEEWKEREEAEPAETDETAAGTAEPAETTGIPEAPEGEAPAEENPDESTEVEEYDE